MMFAWMNDTVTRIRAGEKTVRGSVVPDWEHATEAEITDCNMQPASTSLSTDGRILGISDGYPLDAPIGADIVAGDRIQYPAKTGDVYQINGDVRRWQSPTGSIAHLVVNLMRYSG